MIDFNFTVMNEKSHLLDDVQRFCNRNRWFSRRYDTKDGWIFNFEFSNDQAFEETKSEISRLFPTLYI